jgi:hypothetical protein
VASIFTVEGLRRFVAGFDALIYGYAIPTRAIQFSRHSPRRGMVKAENIKLPKATADSASLHKKMMQLLSSLWVAHAIGAFARLGIADAMDNGAEEPAEIAAPLGLDGDRVFRLLRALSTVGIVTESVGGRFMLTPLGRLLGSRSPHSMRTAASLLTEYHAEIWGKLDGALKGGVAFEALTGQPLFPWLAAHPEEGARFQRMMVEVHGPETPAVVAAYDFSRFRHIVDIGGGRGLGAVWPSHPCGLFGRCDLSGAAHRMAATPTFFGERLARDQQK